MGLNSVTDYWDGAGHLLDDGRREPAGPGEKKQGYRRMKPLQDYACRIDGGGVLEYIHANFARAWERAGGSVDAGLAAQRIAPVGEVQTAERHEAARENDRLAARARAGEGAGSRTRCTSRAQILRTQPEDEEKSIKAFYAHSSEVAHDYLYLENQYFFYPEWAQRLREARAHWVSRWQASYRNTPNPAVRDIKAQDMPILHVMVVTPEPEKAPMVPRTYETLKTLGQEGVMRVQERDAAGRLVIDPKTGKPREIGQDVLVAEAGERSTAFDLQMSGYREQAARGRAAVQHRPNAPQQSDVVRDALQIAPISALQLEKTAGMKVSVAMLYTSGVLGGMVRYRPIYIHSKLMIHSDGCFTLGSANMNQRSMAGDSEINIASDCPFTTRDLRERVFRQLSGGQITGGTGQKAAVATFKAWTGLMQRNRARRVQKDLLEGFLLPFEEGRVCEVRYG